MLTSTSTLWVALFFQGDPVRSWDVLLMKNAATTRAIQAQQQRASAAERRVFEQRFNTLIEALQAFSDAYKQSQGQVWPLKQADALRKACRDLERQMPQKGKSAALDHR